MTKYKFEIIKIPPTSIAASIYQGIEDVEGKSQKQLDNFLREHNIKNENNIILGLDNGSKENHRYMTFYPIHDDDLDVNIQLEIEKMNPIILSFHSQRYCARDMENKAFFGKIEARYFGVLRHPHEGIRFFPGEKSVIDDVLYDDHKAEFLYYRFFGQRKDLDFLEKYGFEYGKDHVHFELLRLDHEYPWADIYVELRAHCP